MVKEENKKEPKTITQRLGKNTIWIIVILSGLFLIIIIYLIVLFELYKGRKFIFSPYTVATFPPDTFFPLGVITQMTAEEIAIRNAIINANS